MKIALIIRKLNVPGGAQRIALAVGDELRKLGHEVVLYTFFYEPEKCFPELLRGFRVVELPKDKRLDTGGFFGFLNDSRMAKELAMLIERNTDILFPHDGPAHHMAYYYKQFTKDIPSVWNMNELPTMRWPLELLSVVENPAFHDIPKRPLWFKKLVTLAKTQYEKRFIRAQNRVVAFDEFHRTLLKRYIGVDATIIPSGNDAQAFGYEAHVLPAPGERLRLLSSGIFLSYRRFEDAIEALAMLRDRGRDVELLILGDYAPDRRYYEKLQELVRNRKLEDRVRFHGRYTDDELREALRTSHIFVYPHLQSQGIAINETIAAGLPTIVTPLMGTYETLKDREHALFAEPRNPASLADAIQTLADDKALYEHISSEGSKHLRENFSWEKQAREFEKIFKGMV